MLRKYTKTKDFSHKQIILSAIYIFISCLFILFLKLALEGVFDKFVVAFLLGLIIILWLSALGVTFFIQDKRLALYCLGIFLFLLVVVFLRSAETVIGISIFSILYYWGIHRAFQDREKFTKIDYIRTLKYCFPLIIIGLAFLLSTIIVSSTISKDSIPERPVPEQLFDVLFVPIETALNIIAPEYESDMSSAQVQEILTDKFLQDGFFQEHLADVRTEEDITFKDAVYDAINTSIQVPLLSIVTYISIFTILALFILFRIVFIILMWLSFLLTILTLKVLMLYNIILVKTQDANRQYLELK